MFTTYCDMAFLDELARAKPSCDPLDYEESERAWLEILDFLIRHTNVVVAASPPDASALSRQPLLRRLMDKPDGTSLTLDNNALRNVETQAFHRSTISPWRMFFLEETAAPHQELSLRFGALFLNVRSAQEAWKRVGRSTTLRVTRQEPKEGRLEQWKDLEQISAPCTGIIICDRYMMPRQHQARDNVYPMLASLLPSGPNDIPVEIMLITEELYNDIESVWHDAIRFVKHRQRRLNFTLSIVQTAGLRKYHDRHVFLNYSFLRSERSLNLFRDGEIVNESLIEFGSSLDRGVFLAALTRLKSLAEVVAMTPDQVGRYRAVVGSKDHHLFRAVRHLDEKWQ